ncbi:flagellar brake protein [Desulfovibrio aminophilus]|uniref:flagellar brake protein n=1 Tax=Desulfovibrio aminophilus TaxID=81425 RepID=UPI0003F8DA55|nr:flagellar brake protein [Desulfovibrio aminophilus]
MPEDKIPAGTATQAAETPSAETPEAGTPAAANHEDSRPAPRLDLTVGGAVLVEIEGLRRSFKAKVVGWDQDRFVLTTFPARPEIRDQLYQDRGLILRYLHPDGTLYGFHSVVDSVLFRPERLLFARYPGKVETLSLRKEDRVNCFVRAGLERTQGEACQGMLLNVSKSGCRFVSGLSVPDPAPVVGETLTVATSFFGCSMELRIPADVRALRQDGQRLTLGLLFREIPEEAARDIERYIQDIKAVLGEGSAQQ